MTMKFSVFKEYLQPLPDNQLKNIYQQYDKIQKRWTKIPCIALLIAGFYYGALGYYSYCAVMISNLFIGSLIDVFDFVNCAICGVIMTTDKPSTLKITPFFLIFLNALKLFWFERITIFTFLTIIYVVIGCIKLSDVVKKLNYMRALPTFPFDTRRVEHQFNAMTTKEQTKYLEHLLINDSKAMDYSDAVTNKKKHESAPTKEDDNEFFQQHNVKPYFSDDELATLAESDLLGDIGDTDSENNDYFQLHL